MMNDLCRLVLSSCHFIATALLLEVVARLRCFGVTRKVMPVVDNFKMAAVGALSIVLMNLSLQLNSVGFYQISKLCIIPTVMAMEFITEGKAQTYRVYLALFILLFGVGIATVNDIDISLKGTYARNLDALSSAA